jgi:hypothetical protein
VQAAEDYMDEDEKQELNAQALAASSDFNTFGGTTADLARRKAEQETRGRPNLIPGPVPDELIVPAADSMGVKLLKKMGWRPGKGVGPKHEVAAAGVCGFLYLSDFERWIEVSNGICRVKLRSEEKMSKWWNQKRGALAEWDQKVFFLQNGRAGGRVKEGLGDSS